MCELHVEADRCGPSSMHMHPIGAFNRGDAPWSVGQCTAHFAHPPAPVAAQRALLR